VWGSNVREDALQTGHVDNTAFFSGRCADNILLEARGNFLRVATKEDEQRRQLRETTGSMHALRVVFCRLQKLDLLLASVFFQNVTQFFNSVDRVRRKRTTGSGGQHHFGGGASDGSGAKRHHVDGY